MSDANKLVIRCAWTGTSAFASAGYGSSWVSGSCTSPSLSPSPPPPSPSPPPPSLNHVFTSKAELKTAVQAYDANLTAAIAAYGPIAEWDVSKITDMSHLFQNLKNFDADISNWNTSGVTTMNAMFRVRSTPVLCAPNLQSSLHCTLDAVAPTC